MKRILFWVLAALIVIGLILGLTKGPALQRALKVKTLFDQDKIVHNFSNMDDVLKSRSFPASDYPHVWNEAPEALPETVMINGEERNLEDWLIETDTTSFLIIRGNDILFEQYYLGTSADDRRISWSVAKSFLSAVFGTAVDNGEIKSLDDKVSDYVPSLKDSAYADASIRSVLNMASGVQFNEDYMDQDSDINRMGRTLAWGRSMDEFAATLDRQDRAPGTARHYVSIDTHVLGMVARAATGKSMNELYQERLWDKLGASHSSYYLTDNDGVAFVLGGLNLTTRDYALFGALFRDGGQWRGEQVVPEGWVAASTVKSAPAPAFADGYEYGYQWWVPKEDEGDYYANGIYGQSIYVNPKRNIVIVKTSADREFMQDGISGQWPKLDGVDVFQSLARYFSPDPEPVMEAPATEETE